ncbi:glycosyl hydrolase [Streptomyces sp. NA04227]|uniref:glycoside hydrolase family 31 protein n=1 Tax=Streptomyces sp. NA04227 TaxID=2742136 RepID=UPI001591304B|nr:glycoside hydrolase family 31 protein [Streptomyces sp. NA04227]QKW05408.1 glycosyl hydrolase [Streptomyces sp. NA04227]
MNARSWLRTVKSVGATSPSRSLRAWRGAWRNRRLDAAATAGRRGERARVPGALIKAEPEPGGGVLGFERTTLRITVTTGGAVFLGWDGAEPLPSYALTGRAPQPDSRAQLEPDKDGGWRVVSERAMVVVSRHGAVEVRTPGGVVLRRELPPRWWESAEGVSGRWVQRSEVAADARFFGLGGRAGGPRLRGGTYRLWNTDPGGSFGPDDDPLYLTMPVQLVVADAGTHLVFHDCTWDGSVTLREGEEGAGSGHDRPGRSELRMEGGPLRCWILVGAPSRVLRTWVSLTGAPALPPSWALGHHHARWGFGGEREVRRVLDGYRAHGLPLDALHLDIDHFDRHQVFTVDHEHFPKLAELAAEALTAGTRLVSIVDPAVKADPANAVYAEGTREDVFVRDGAGRSVRGVVWPGESVYPDFTDPKVRRWWGGLYEERLGHGFAGFWHDMNEPVSFAPFGDPTLPRSARHALDGQGGDHRAAHNVYALCMARAGYEGLVRLRPRERPFLFSRSGWAGLQRYGGTWSGDVASDWQGLRASLSLVLGLGLCGVPYSGPDIGGFDGEPSPELYLRWFQLGAHLPLFRTHSALDAGRREPWEFGEEILEYARAALLQRRRLHPYLVTLAHVAHRSGAPYVRPLWWSDPADRALRDCEDAFLLGDALLVAPVLEPEVRQRAVRLPRGHWYDTATGRLHRGPGQVLLDAPLSRVPVLARAGAVIPVRGEDGEVELEVWAPVEGRSGGGLVVPDAGDGWEKVVAERFTSAREQGTVIVRGKDGEEPGYTVHVRGL